MSLHVTANTPNHASVVQALQGSGMTPRRLYAFATEVGNADMQMILDYLQRHIRTGQTFSSIKMRVVDNTNTRVSVAVGTQSRGSQLRFLDRGRGEVRPINRRFLRYIAHPSGVVVFSRYSRATQPSNIMRLAAQAALAKAPEIAAKAVATPSYVT